MVLRNYIKIICAALIFFLIVLLFSCEDGFLFMNCSDCSPDEPKEVYLEIDLDQNAQGTTVSIYEGNLEDSLLYDEFITYSKSAFYKVPINKSYTLTASYSIDGKTYVAVNSVIPRIKLEEDRCSEPCYYVYDKDVNLTLKFSK